MSSERRDDECLVPIVLPFQVGLALGGGTDCLCLYIDDDAKHMRRNVSVTKEGKLEKKQVTSTLEKQRLAACLFGVVCPNFSVLSYTPNIIVSQL